jgi:ATP-dependent RNA helicase DDX60
MTCWGLKHNEPSTTAKMVILLNHIKRKTDSSPVSEKENVNRYNNLYSRTVDLVGDYAGDELFLIEGDSLLLRSFSDEKLDFWPGFQILHATYIVETFLHKLHQRKCVFHIVFFADHAHLCIPNGIHEDLRPRYLLAREVIIQHLSQSIGQVSPLIEIKVFNNYHSEEFRDHLANSGAYFFMCHDGAFVESQLLGETGNEASESEQSSDDSEGWGDGTYTRESCFDIRDMLSRIDLRLMIHWFVVMDITLRSSTTLNSGIQRYVWTHASRFAVLTTTRL